MNALSLAISFGIYITGLMILYQDKASAGPIAALTLVYLITIAIIQGTE